MTNPKRVNAQMVRKLLVIGDGMSGKTSLLCAFKGDEFNPTSRPHVLDTYLLEAETHGKSFHLALFDTGGGEDYSRLRPLSYPDTNVFLICFSVDIPPSAFNVVDVYNPEVRHFCSGCPIILVACKIDLRTDSSTLDRMKRQGETPVTSETGRHIAAEIKANSYMECSSKTREGIADLLAHATRLAFEHRPHTRSRRKRSCFLC